MCDMKYSWRIAEELQLSYPNLAYLRSASGGSATKQYKKTNAEQTSTAVNKLNAYLTCAGLQSLTWNVENKILQELSVHVQVNLGPVVLE